MIERGEVEPHFGLRRGDPPAQLEERYQAFPPTGLITFPKVVISDPHAQIGESDLKPRHELIFGVIQFLHFAFACSKLFLLAKNESQGSTRPFTVVQLAFSGDPHGFEQDAPVMHLPLSLQLLGFDGEEAGLSGLAHCL
jgi:hypothetical protein